MTLMLVDPVLASDGNALGRGGLLTLGARLAVCFRLSSYDHDQKSLYVNNRMEE